jgi:hypothetical protein
VGTTYDTGALISAERADERIWTLHRRTLETGVIPVVPAAVLAQAWRGGPQVNLSRMLKSCEIEDLTEVVARRAGALCARAGTSDVVDATVAVGAASRGDRVVTADPDDLRLLCAALGVAVPIEAL